MGAWISVGYEHRGILVGRKTAATFACDTTHSSTPPEAPLRVSAITLGEIEYGLRVVSEDSTALQEAFRELVDRRLPMVLDISKTTRMYYGLLRARLFEKYAPRHRRRRGLRPEQLIDPVRSRELGIQENDLWLAAQALEFNLVLATNDALEPIRAVCEELQMENWAA
jgi:tRNA(fMet)-specific endonuclease VapC